jgi:MYND finger
MNNSNKCNHCGKTEEDGVNLLRCGHCEPLRVVWYCSQNCQKAEWKEHKKLCGKSDEEIVAATGNHSALQGEFYKGLHTKIDNPFHLLNDRSGCTTGQKSMSTSYSLTPIACEPKTSINSKRKIPKTRYMPGSLPVCQLSASSSQRPRRSPFFSLPDGMMRNAKNSSSLVQIVRK